MGSRNKVSPLMARPLRGEGTGKGRAIGLKKVPMAIKLYGGGGKGLNGLAISGGTFFSLLKVKKIFFFP